MDCKKCGMPMYHPSPNKLCPKCEGERLDKWIAEQEAAQQSVNADVMPCGHPLAESYQGAGGGTYCRICESA